MRTVPITSNGSLTAAEAMAAATEAGVQLVLVGKRIRVRGHRVQNSEDA